jgi:penicillin-binding protein 2
MGPTGRKYYCVVATTKRIYYCIRTLVTRKLYHLRKLAGATASGIAVPIWNLAMSKRKEFGRFLAVALSLVMVYQPAMAATAAAKPAAKTTKASASSSASKKTTTHKVVGVPTFADSTKDDFTKYDDPIVRAAAVQALGRYNGSVVAIDPATGRILTVVNQKLAFSNGFIPCSTIKPTIALAALQEGIITRDSMIKVAPRRYMNLTEAMAHSNNIFFESLGSRMGFDTVSRYAHMLGLGELAGYSIPEEQAGSVTPEAPKRGGVARMSSFGEGIQMTPLELASLVATLANGGTMYYLQYPRSEEALRDFAPRVKRQLDIGPYVSDIREGMQAAVLYGTAKSSYDHEGEQPLGKTGTCSDEGSRLGWFVSYANQENPRIALVVLVRGHAHKDEGPYAAAIAGRIYHSLKEQNFFAAEHTTSLPLAAILPNR